MPYFPGALADFVDLVVPELRPQGEQPRVIMLTTFDQDEYIYDALRAGASGFVLKDVPPALVALVTRQLATLARSG